jgi:hypothetical protein
LQAEASDADGAPLNDAEQKRFKKYKDTAVKSWDKASGVVASVKDIIDNTLVPAAEKVLSTNQPLAITIGNVAFNLTVQFAKELLQSPVFLAFVCYGFSMDTTLAPETWNEWFYRKIVTGGPAPELSHLGQFMKFLSNMRWAAQAGFHFHMKSIFWANLAKTIMRAAETYNNVTHGSTKRALQSGVKAIHGIYRIMGSRSVVARVATKRFIADKSDSEQSAVSRSASSSVDERQLALSDADRPLALTDAPPRATVRRRVRGKTNAARNYLDQNPAPTRTRLREKTNVGAGAPLVNYHPGVRQSKRGGRATISGLAPVLEFNEMADDPYVMRPPIQ